MIFEQKESFIEEQVGYCCLSISWSYLQYTMDIVYNKLSSTCSDEFLMVSITFLWLLKVCGFTVVDNTVYLSVMKSH